MNAGRLFVKVVFILVSLVLLIGQAQAQTCPPDKVCLDRDQAAYYLTLEDTVKAKDAEIKVKDAALSDAQKEIGTWRVDYAKLMGEKTGAEQMNVRLTAIIDFMLKNGRTKKYGIINF